MKTNVTQTSIQAYHALTSKYPLKRKIAEYILTETRHGRPCCIADIVGAFSNIGNIALAQKSTVSARLNELKKSGIEIDGKEYVLHPVSERKSRSTGILAEHFCLVLASAAKTA